MKRKIISSTYLRDVDKYQIKIYLDFDDYYLSIKKLIKVREKFIIKNNICVMDDNYYVVEVVPKHENYAMRIFYDDNKNPLEYYFDICKNNGLLEGFSNCDITKDELDMIYNIKDKLVYEISNKINKYMNIDYSKYLDF